MSVSIILPACNEAERISAVLDAVKASHYQKVVVANGCTDKTAEVARGYESHNVVVIEMKERIGKATAMRIGLRRAEGDIVVFVDTDLEGLTEEHVKKLVRKLKKRRVKIVKAVLVSRKRFGVTLSQILFTFLGGQQAAYKDTWMEILYPIPESMIRKLKYGVELYITLYRVWQMMKSGFRDWRASLTFLVGVSQVTKPEKTGKKEGFRDRFAMYRQIPEAFRVFWQMKKSRSQ